MEISFLSEVSEAALQEVKVSPEKAEANLMPAELSERTEANQMPKELGENESQENASLQRSEIGVEPKNDEAIQDGNETEAAAEKSPSQDVVPQSLTNDVTDRADTFDAEIRESIADYCNDIKDKSEYPQTIPHEPFDCSDIRLRTPEENAQMREQFSEIKSQLKRAWEEQTGLPWPKYDHDVYSANGNLIRKAGSDYDAHHIQPLALGGKNEASNITPLSAEVHYDKQGVHSPYSPYSKLVQQTGGSER